MADKSSRLTELGPGGVTPGQTGPGAGNAAYRYSGQDLIQAELNKYKNDPNTGNPVTRPAAANAERQSALLESVARDRKIAERAASFTGRAAGNAERARNEAIETRDRINRETNKLLQQLVTIRRDIESRMQDAGRNAELARSEAETAERQATNAQARAQHAKTNAELARNEAETAERQATNAQARA